MSHVLLIDTTLTGVAVGVATDGSLIWSECDSDHRGASRLPEILESARSVLQIPGWEYLAVSCGPGSFTGIKIGLAFAQGLMRGAKQKLRGIGLSSLELVAAGLMQQDSSFAALYLAATKTRGAVAMRSGSKLALSDTDISIERPPIEGNIYLMEAWPMLESQVSRQLVPIADPLRVSLEVMAKKVESLARESFRSDIIFEPLYLRKSTAEESLARIQEKKKG